MALQTTLSNGCRVAREAQFHSSLYNVKFACRCDTLLRAFVNYGVIGTVAVDVLQVPMSYQHNKYFLVVQDYCTKWAEAIPMPNQMAVCITQELVKIFSAL